MFDQMIQEVAQRFGLGDKADSLVQSVVGMVTDERSGGLQGFLSAFDEEGMGSAVRSWVGRGASEQIDASQVESALGGGVIADLARKFGLDRGMVGGALAFLIPRIVDLLTPEGNVPSNASLMNKLGGFLGGAGAAAGKVGDAARGVAGGAQRMAGGTVDEVGQAARKGGGTLKWLLLLLILALALWWFAKSCQPQSTDGGIGEGAETTEMMEGRDVSGVDGDLAREAEAGADAVADGAKNAGEAVMGGVRAAGDAVIDGAKAAGHAVADGAKVASDAAAGGAKAAGDVAMDGTQDVAGAAAAGAVAAGDAAVDTAAAADDAVAAGARTVGDTAAAGAGMAGEAATDAVDRAAEAAGQERFDAAATVARANETSGTALAALGDDFGAQQLVDALNLSIINFASGSAAIPEASQPLLREAAQAMRRLPAATRIEIGGHTDSTGSEAANGALSAARAGAVKETLVGHGVPAEMLSIRGYGSAQPMGSNDTEEGRFRNRRISYTLLD